MLIGAIWTLMTGLGLAVGSAHAQNHIVAQAWLEDPAGHMTLADVQKSDQWKPYKGVLSRGFGSSAVWVRLTINPMAHDRSDPAPGPLVLRVRPVYLDRIEIHDLLDPSGEATLMGDGIHPRKQSIASLDFVSTIARGGQSRDIWLRLTSTSTRQLSVQVLNPDDLNRSMNMQELLYALYLGVIIVFLAWAVVHWLFSQEHLVGAFGLAQLCSLIYASCALGYARVFWPIDYPAAWLDGMTSLFSILAVSTAILFHVLHTREFQPPAVLRWMGLAFLMLLPVKLMLLMLGEPRLGLTLNMVEVMVSPSVFLASVIWARGWTTNHRSNKPALKRAYVVGFYVALWVMMLVAAVPGLGLMAGGEIPLYIVQAHGLITAFLIMVMLQYRDRVVRQKQTEMAMSLERSIIQAEQEKSIREEQENLLTMLAHELKTPLATMHMRLDARMEGSREIRNAIRDMDGVIERCVQTIKLSDQQLQAHTQSLNLVSVLQEAIATCAQPDRVRLDAPVQLMLDSDRQLLGICLSNLLENACKYAAKETAIEIRVSTERPAWYETEPTVSSVWVEMSNSPGPSGWPDPVRMFEKYYRSPTARRQAGTGLGLFLVKNLLQVLKGEIRYVPDAEKVRFGLILPRPTDAA